MKKKKYIFMLLMNVLLICSCSNKHNGNESVNVADNEDTNMIQNDEEKPIVDNEKNTFSGEVVIESESYSDNGIYLSWYSEEELNIGFLNNELVTEYGYPMGTKVKMDATMDGTTKTESGKDCWYIDSISYVDDITVSTDFVDGYSDILEGIAYVEKQYEEGGNTYIVFGFEFEPDIYYIAEMNGVSYDMSGDNYYFNIIFNPGDEKAGYQYCEISSWDLYDYNTNDFNSDSITEVNSEQVGLEVDYDSAYYSEESDIWLLGNTQLNGCPVKITGYERLYLEDGYLYFLGELENEGDKLINAFLDVKLYSKEGKLINTINKVEAFNYNKEYAKEGNEFFPSISDPRYDYSITGENIKNSNYKTEGDGTNLYTLANSDFFSRYIIANSSACFGFGIFYEEAKFNDFTQYESNGEIRISDYDILYTYYLRNLNCEVGYIYVTVNDYKYVE